MGSEDLPEMMDDEEAELGEMEFEDSDFLTTDPALIIAENNLDRFMAVASVEAVFSEPVKNGDILVIHAAEVGCAMGFGIGSGTGSGEQGSGNGSGGGGGGWNFSRPVAEIVVTPDGVEVKPIVDVTKIGIAALTTVGFMAALAGRMLRPRR
jgi:uncharacterized spore protein YtfJ